MTEAHDRSQDFPIDQKLLEDATHAREEWRVLKDRLEKIDENKGNVTKAVYERVKKDYEAKLIAATDVVFSKKELIDKEITTLKGTLEKIRSQHETHAHKLEEIKFRNTLGEFTEEDFQTQQKAEQEKISKFETIIAAIETNIARYCAIFEGSEEIFGEKKAPLPQKTEKKEVQKEVPEDEPTPEPKKAAPHDREPVTDAKGFVVEEEAPDYFGATGDPITEPQIEEASDTSRAPSELDVPTEKDSRPARIVVLNGEDTGAAYPVKNTVSFGRAESNTVVLRDTKISRQHAEIQKQGGEYVIVDLNSSNGTFVNGQRIEEYVLSNGDEIQMGDFVLQFQQ